MVTNIVDMYICFASLFSILQQVHITLLLEFWLLSSLAFEDLPVISSNFCIFLYSHNDPMDGSMESWRRWLKPYCEGLMCVVVLWKARSHVVPSLPFQFLWIEVVSSAWYVGFHVDYFVFELNWKWNGNQLETKRSWRNFSKFWASIFHF